MRLMAIDGTLDSVPDTESNLAYFRYSSDDEVSRSPFPQVLLVLLIECGTHLICDVEPSSCRQGEPTSARDLLARSLGPDMLLLWDSGFHSSALIFLARGCCAQVLGRVICNVLTKPIKRLSDGSYLTYIYEDQDHQCGERMLVRVISYTFSDERVPGADQTIHRLVTTLLDPEQYPAHELAMLFHERWHVEVIFDEIETHLRRSSRTLRSLTPEGVLQKLYGLLLAHIAVRTLMRHSAQEADVAPTQLSFTGTMRILDESLPALTLASWAHRLTLTQHLLVEIAAERLSAQRLRFQARVVNASVPSMSARCRCI